MYLLRVCQMRDIDSISRGNAVAQTGATQYNAQLGLQDKGRLIYVLDVYNMVGI